MSRKSQDERSLNARLQDRIILYLGEHEDVETVSRLSQVLGSPRSSTSRAINRLKRDGLVQKVEGRWALTSEGRKEVATLRPRARKRSNRAYKEIQRLERLQREWDRTVGSSVVQQAIKDQAYIREAMRSQSAIDEVMQAQTTSLQAMDGRSIMKEMVNAQSAIQDVQVARSSLLQVDAQVRPFFEAMRLVDSVGVGNPAISATLEAVSATIQANQATYVESISKVAAQVSSLALTKLESLSDTLSLVNHKLGESAFALVQVRAVEDLLRQIPSSGISSDTLDAFASQVDFASGPTVRHILEQADARTLLDEEVDVTETASDTLAATPSVSLDDADSVFLWQNWDQLSEMAKLRFVAAATFIILHLALAGAQKAGDSEYVKDLIQAGVGTAAVVAVCKELELFKEDE